MEDDKKVSQKAIEKGIKYILAHKHTLEGNTIISLKTLIERGINIVLDGLKPDQENGKTINPSGNKFHIEHEKEECFVCGIIGIPTHVLFEKAFSDAFIFCSDDCLFAYCQGIWAERNIRYCNSKWTLKNKNEKLRTV